MRRFAGLDVLDARAEYRHELHLILHRTHHLHTRQVCQLAERLERHVRITCGNSGHALHRQVLHHLLGHTKSGKHRLHQVDAGRARHQRRPAAAGLMKQV
jgi:hypothetical protein